MKKTYYFAIVIILTLLIIPVFSQGIKANWVYSQVKAKPLEETITTFKIETYSRFPTQYPDGEVGKKNQDTFNNILGNKNTNGLLNESSPINAALDYNNLNDLDRKYISSEDYILDNGKYVNVRESILGSGYEDMYFIMIKNSWSEKESFNYTVFTTSINPMNAKLDKMIYPVFKTKLNYNSNGPKNEKWTIDTSGSLIGKMRISEIEIINNKGSVEVIQFLSDKIQKDFKEGFLGESSEKTLPVKPGEQVIAYNANNVSNPPVYVSVVIRKGETIKVSNLNTDSEACISLYTNKDYELISKDSKSVTIKALRKKKFIFEVTGKNSLIEASLII